MDATLEDVMSLNDQMAALVEAGIPLELGLDRQTGDAASALERINAQMARRIGGGDALLTALQGDAASVPASYRGMMQLAIRSENPCAALDGARRVAESVDESRYAATSALVYPLIVCGLAYVGLIGICLYFLPAVADAYRDLEIAPGGGLQTLLTLREWLPYWAVLPPIAVAAWAAGHWRRTADAKNYFEGDAGSVGRSSPAQQAVFQQRCAKAADTIAALLEAETSLEESLTIAAETCGDRRLRGTIAGLAKSAEQGALTDAATTATLQGPPFLQWALCHSDEPAERVGALRMAGDVYRTSAERLAERSRIAAPIMACVVLGGGATLLYGLAVFTPVVDMLRALAD